MLFGEEDTVTPLRVNNIDYVHFSSTGNAADFGDLRVARTEVGSAASKFNKRFIWRREGSISRRIKRNTADYFTMASTGNAIDFGDLNCSKILFRCG